MAGGEGRRLKSVTGDLPKPMVPLLGKPLMERIINLLKAAGITEICAALGYNPAPIIAHFGSGESLGVHLVWRVEDSPLGTAGGVKNCADFLGGDDFLVISGDAACDFDLTKLIAEHARTRPAVTMALHESADPLRYGLVLADAGGDVRCFIEKPAWERVVTNLVNTGIYIVSAEAMSLVPDGAPFDFARDLFPLLMERGERIHGVVMDGYWCDVGAPREYFECCLDALDGRLRLFESVSEPSAPAAPAARPPLAGGRKCGARVPCRDRARLMRALSAQMMECGADFTDGLCLAGERCGVRVSPVPDAPELLIEASSDDAAFSRELADAAEAMALGLEAGLEE